MPSAAASGMPLLRRPGHDIDLATDARPDRILELFPAGQPRGVFGTVEVDGVEITTFRRDHTYRDHRRPDEVTWTDDVDDDLRRRDFTVNALAWGRPAGSTGAGEPGLHDPTGGCADLEARLLRAVGDPDARFEEDALRLLRGARFAATLGLTIEPRTLDAMRDHGPEARWLSAERIGGELRRMLTEARPSDGLRILDATGVLAVVLPEVAAQHGVPQAKVPGHDLFDHAMATTDTAAALPRHVGAAHPGGTAPRHRQACDGRRRALHRPCRGRRPHGVGRAPPAALASRGGDIGRAPHRGSTCSSTARRGPTRPSGGSCDASVRTTSTTCCVCARRTTWAAARIPTPTTCRSSGRGWMRSGSPTCRSPVRPCASPATTW